MTGRAYILLPLTVGGRQGEAGSPTVGGGNLGMVAQHFRKSGHGGHVLE